MGIFCRRCFSASRLRKGSTGETLLEAFLVVGEDNNGSICKELELDCEEMLSRRGGCPDTLGDW